MQEALLLGSARILRCRPERKGGLLLPIVSLLASNFYSLCYNQTVIIVNLDGLEFEQVGAAKALGVTIT